MNILSKCWILLALCGLVICGGCQSLTSSTAKGASTSNGAVETLFAHRGPEVEVVRNGVLTQYNTTTVGKAFEGTFQNAKWSSFDTPKGQTVVQFDGTVTQEALASANLNLYKAYDSVRNGCIASLGVTDELKQLGERMSKSQNEFTRKTWPINIFAETDKVAAEQGLRTYDAAALVRERKEKRDAEALAVAQQEQRETAQAQASINGKIAECMKITPAPVKFQFVLSADKKTFEIGYIDNQVFNQPDKALEFIYH